MSCLTIEPPTLTETWRAVPDWADLYQASDLGRVRSLDRITLSRAGWMRAARGRTLKAKHTTNGYREVRLQASGRDRYVGVHVLVALAFHGPKPPGHEVRHLDGVRDHNWATNLRWGTKAENSADRREHGTNHELNKVTCPRQHPLETPNLVAAPARAGHRACLACNRAHAYAHYLVARCNEPQPDIDALAAAYFAELMGGAA